MPSATKNTEQRPATLKPNLIHVNKTMNLDRKRISQKNWISWSLTFDYNLYPIFAVTLPYLPPTFSPCSRKKAAAFGGSHEIHGTIARGTDPSRALL
ncbi:hypothetical protein CDAR_552301 [Caerostris darwini]|uniref:Uncharacterized protein n=1 Tax=Caerostris darwini TaxID=1538125 RepID=A0AAV4NLQ0_9ARAC|nr:hypothetical protein CDAR_552301 [Caerostris darwini]